ncbi:Single-minded-like protein 1 [Sarcoptes scabiei]|nr:Single-minded-like protein 1 [Sarcoptes scabiei]
MPSIRKPNQVLIKVFASSINPLDVEMIRGYGDVVMTADFIFNRNKDILSLKRLPLVLGRDFVGRIVDKGENVVQNQIGDIVWGTVFPFYNGSHADYVITNEESIFLKPKNLTNVQAASIPFAALTAWSAITTYGNCNPLNCSGKNVLILGGSGAVGNIACQLLQNWGANVVTTSSPKTLDQLKLLINNERCIDYNEMKIFLQQYEHNFDLILDASSSSKTSEDNYTIVKEIMRERFENRLVAKSILPCPCNTVFITLNPPLLRNFDQNGLVFGALKNLNDVLCDTISSSRYSISYRWGFFNENRKALEYLTMLYETNRLRLFDPKVFRFDQAINAYNLVQNRKANGKVVLDLEAE